MDEHLLFLFSFLDEVEKEIADDAEKQAWIEKCINIKTLSDFTVSCSYGDMVLIICVLKDYLKLIANKEGPTWDYYRDKFSKMAYRLSGQIGYNYEKAYERCQKKMNGKIAMMILERMQWHWLSNMEETVKRNQKNLIHRILEGKMKRLTHKLANGLSTGYWSGRSKADLVERLAEYENTGLTPEEIHIAMRNLEILEERMKEENDR